MFGFIKSFKSSFHWILLITGLLLFTFTEFYQFFLKQESFSETISKNGIEYLGGLAKAILIGGIFSAIVHTFEYMGVFKNALIGIVMGTDYLNNRKDIAKYWEDVTRLLFQNKFPNINNQITRDVQDIYLPINSLKYHENTKQIITIHLVDRTSQLIEVTHETSFKIVTWDKDSTIIHKFDNQIICQSNTSADEQFDLISFKVDDDPAKLKVNDTKRVKNKLNTKIEVELSGKLNYDVVYIVKKRYCLKYDNVIGNLSQYISDGLIVQFHFKNLRIKVIEIGTVKNFKTSQPTSEFLEVNYTGLIYPQQGYIAIIEKL